MGREPITNFYGKILGWWEVDSKGNKTYMDFYGKIIARYNSVTNETTDFYGKVLAKGDIGAGLVYQLDDK